MNEVPKCTWAGKSGTQYEYKVYPIRNTTFNEVPGNYIFTKIKDCSWTPCYIGQAENLKERLANHEKQTCVIKNGATHIHARVNYCGEQARRREEKDLILLHQPCCNEQYVD